MSAESVPVLEVGAGYLARRKATRGPLTPAESETLRAALVARREVPVQGGDPVRLFTFRDTPEVRAALALPEEPVTYGA